MLFFFKCTHILLYPIVWTKRVRGVRFYSIFFRSRFSLFRVVCRVYTVVVLASPYKEHERLVWISVHNRIIRSRVGFSAEFALHFTHSSASNSDRSEYFIKTIHPFRMKTIKSGGKHTKKASAVTPINVFVWFTNKSDVG